MGLFNNQNASDILSSIKKTVADSAKQISDGIKQQNQEANQAKAPVDGAIIRYGVIYLGGLAQYPKRRSGEIGFNIMPDSFYLKPTITSKDWFDDMVILYEKVRDFKITKRQITMSEQMLANDTRSLEQDNNIEITYLNDENNEVVLRLEMLTGISVAGQAVKCREMMDLLRQNGILKRLIKTNQSDSETNGQDILQKIRELSELKEVGILTEDEFAVKKQELLKKI